jgi:hypothetical protein
LNEPVVDVPVEHGRTDGLDDGVMDDSEEEVDKPKEKKNVLNEPFPVDSASEEEAEISEINSGSQTANIRSKKSGTEVVRMCLLLGNVNNKYD